MSAAHNLIPEGHGLPAIGETDGQGDRAVARVKIFDPTGSWTWYLTEYSSETDEAFGLVDGFEQELGYIPMRELRSLKGALGLPLERDLHWTPKTLGEIRGR